MPAPIFLTPDEQRAAVTEFEKLASLPPAPNWLAQQVLNFAKSHADDPHVPEALHLVVTAGHLGCTDEATATFSKSAFQLLHKNYPASDWAKKTPYWSLVFALSLPMRVLGMGAHEAKLLLENNLPV